MTTPTPGAAAAHAAALLDLVRYRSPEAAELASLLSLAVRIEPALLRAARLHADLPASAEADLWFSAITSSRSVNLGISFVPAVAEILRQELRAVPERRKLAWQLVSDHHGDQPWSIRLEEQINYLMTDPVAQPSHADDLLGAALRELYETRLTDERAAVGIARWLLAALARVPPAVRVTPTAATASVAAGIYFDGWADNSEQLSLAARSELLPWLLDRLGTAIVPVRLLPGAVAIGGNPEGAIPFPVPATRPLVVSVSWGEDSGPRPEYVYLDAGEQQVLPVGSPEVELRALNGGGLLLRPAGLGRVLTGGDRWGGGFAVAPRLVLTAAHVVGSTVAREEGTDSPPREAAIRYVPDGGEPIPARVAGIDDQLDVALLELTQATSAIVPIGQIDDRASGHLRPVPMPDQVATRPAETPPGIRGTIFLAAGDRLRFEVTSGPINSDDLMGSSGRPLMLDNPWGAAVGLLTSIDASSPDHPTSLFATPIDRIVTRFRLASLVTAASAGLAGEGWATTRPLNELLDSPLRDSSLPTLAEIEPSDLGLPDLQSRSAAEFRRTAEFNEAASELRRAFAMPGFIIVSGPSSDRAALTAYLAARSLLPDVALIAPKPEPGALRESTIHPQVLGYGGPLIVWLNDLLPYLQQPDGLDLMVISRFLGRSETTIVLGTISEAELSGLRSGGLGSPDIVQPLLDQATVISLAEGRPTARDARTVARPAAFMSYARFDDEHDDGQLTLFRQRLAAEVRAQTGQEFPIFQDRADIAWGQNWQQRINETLDVVTLLVAIITPAFFASRACRDETARFLERERKLGRDDLILPVYYISARQMDDPALRDSDELARVLATRQFADWRELRFEPFTSPQARRAIAQLASRMRDSIWRPQSGSASSAPEARPPAADGTARHRIVIGYARSDRMWLERILKQLRPAQESVIDVYADTDIRPGTEWYKIQDSLNAAAVVILLVSPDFLASDFAGDPKFLRLLDSSAADGVRVIPVIVRPSSFEGISSLSRFQAANPPSTPLAEMTSAQQEEFYIDLARGVARITTWKGTAT